MNLILSLVLLAARPLAILVLRARLAWWSAAARSLSVHKPMHTDLLEVLATCAALRQKLNRMGVQA